MFKYLLKSDLTEYVTKHVKSSDFFFSLKKPVQLKLKTLYHSCGFYIYWTSLTSALPTLLTQETLASSTNIYSIKSSKLNLYCSNTQEGLSVLLSSWDTKISAIFLLDLSKFLNASPNLQWYFSTPPQKQLSWKRRTFKRIGSPIL